MKVTKPGLYAGISDEIYHGGRNTPTASLSQSMLKLLIPPSTPAHFAWRLHHPEPPKRVFDIGRAAHTRALGVGEDMAPCPRGLLSVDGKMTTTKAKDWVIEQRALGIVPLTPTDYDMVLGMAEALVHHDRIAELLTDPDKQPEVSAYAIHPDAGVWLRGRFDLLGGQLWDYKTSRSADPAQFVKSAIAYGYHVQCVTYRLLYAWATGEPDPGPMTFVVQEKTPPYLVSTVVLDDEFACLARAQLDAAIDLYRVCVTADHWPGYPDEVVTLTPPAWALKDVDASAAVDVLDDLERIISA